MARTTKTAAPHPNSAAARDRAELREHQALELRMAGATFPQIAEALSFSDRSAAKKAYDRALRRARDEFAENVAEHRAEQMVRLERLLRAVWPAATNPDHPRHVQANARAQALLERQARLLGLDAPTRVQVTSEMDDEIETLLAEMAEVERAAALAEQAPE